MKRTIQTLSVVIAVAATVQAIQAYASEKKLSVELEGNKFTELIEIKRDIDFYQNSDWLSYDPSVQLEFPQIQTENDVKRQMARQALRYLISIGAEEELKQELKNPRAVIMSDPGI